MPMRSPYWEDYYDWQGQDWRSPLRFEDGEDPVPPVPPPAPDATNPNPGLPGSDTDPYPWWNNYDWGGEGEATLPPGAPSFSFSPVPKFKAPVFDPQSKFRAPSPEDLLNEPGYRFRLGDGEGALERSAAGRGTLRTGGTLKDILAWGQNYAAQEYSNAFDRARQGYEANYGQERDVFDRFYTGRKDEYAPLITEWQTQSSAAQRAAELAFLQEWANYNKLLDIGAGD